MPLPPRFADLKREIAESYPDFERRVTDAWAEIVQQLKETSEVVKREGSDVRFFSLSSLECLWNSRSDWVMLCSIYLKSSLRSCITSQRKLFRGFEKLEVWLLEMWWMMRTRLRGKSRWMSSCR